MNLFKGVGNLNETIFDCVLTIGTFDGIHLGHQEILNKMSVLAKEEGSQTVVLTFSEHPQKTISNRGAVKLLNSNSEKEELLKQFGINACVYIPFTKDVANIKEKDFIKNFLYRYFRPKAIVVGYNYHFGKNRKGNIDTLRANERFFNYTTYEISKHYKEGNEISSTQIRNFLLEGEIKKANLLLGYRYSLEGVVVRGNGMGRIISFPTANIKVLFNEKLIPKNSVYAVDVNINGDKKSYKGMLNIGVNPTVSNLGVNMLEVNIFDFCEDIYGKKVKVIFKDRLRPEIKFENMENLKLQLKIDKEQSLKI